MKATNSEIRTSSSSVHFDAYAKNRARASQERSEFIAEGVRILAHAISRLSAHAANAVVRRSRLLFRTA